MKKFLALFVPLLFIFSQQAFALMLISQETEVSIGQEVAKEVREKYGICADHSRLLALKKVGDKLTKISKRKGIIYSFEIAATKEVNAFACPGGPIFITQGLLEKMETEDQLSAVISHEFAHIERQHGRKAINKSLVATIALAILLKDTKETLKTGVKIGWNLIDLGYSREDEREADKKGLSYQVKIGYNPFGMIELFKILGGKEYKGLVKYLTTHPSTPKRIEAIESQIQKEFQNQQFAQSIKLPLVDPKMTVVFKPKVEEEVAEQKPP